MKRLAWIIPALLLAGFVRVPAAWGLSLADAIEQSAEKIQGELPAKSRVAIIAFESPNANLSEYIIDELTGALAKRGIETADRRNLEFVFKELNFQLPGTIDEKTARYAGKMLGAQLVITGQLEVQGKNYRCRINAVHVEKGTLAEVTGLNVENNKTMKNLV